MIAFHLPDSILKADLFGVQGWKDQNKQKLPLIVSLLCFFSLLPFFRADIALAFYRLKHLNLSPKNRPQKTYHKYFSCLPEYHKFCPFSQ